MDADTTNHPMDLSQKKRCLGVTQQRLRYNVYNRGQILHNFVISENETETDISNEAYTTDVLKNLDAARKEGSFCDITLLVGPQRHPIKAHRLILASASEYFRTYFKTDVKEHRQKEKELPKMDAPTMEVLIDFIYTGRIKLTNENVVEIATTASFWGIGKMVERCVKYISGKINERNSIKTLEFAEHISNQYLKYFTMMFIIQNLESIMSKNLDITNMKTSLLLEIIGNNATSIHQDPAENEERLFQIGWNHLQSKSRDVFEIFLPKLLQAIHLPCVSKAFWEDLEKRLGNHRNVEKLLQDAKHIKAKNSIKSEAEMKTLSWGMNRFPKSGMIYVLCKGVRNDSSLNWGMAAFINGIPWCLYVKALTMTSEGSSEKYLVAGIHCMNSSIKSIPCKVKLWLVAPKNQTPKQDYEITEFSHTFTSNSRNSGYKGIVRLREVMAQYYDSVTESCTLKAEVSPESDILYFKARVVFGDKDNKLECNRRGPHDNALLRKLTCNPGKQAANIAANIAAMLANGK